MRALRRVLWGLPLTLMHFAAGEPPVTVQQQYWMERQMSRDAHSCCGRGDAHRLDDDHWRMRGGQYEVLIEAHWIAIPPEHLLQATETDPNPMEGAVVWYGTNTLLPYGVNIYCFAPGTVS